MKLIHRISHSLIFWQVMFFAMSVVAVISYARGPRVVIKEKVVIHTVRYLPGGTLSDSYESKVM